VEHPASGEHLQVVGQAEVVFVSICHGFHDAAGAYDPAMRTL
jgi:hypothetical protein